MADSIRTNIKDKIGVSYLQLITCDGWNQPTKSPHLQRHGNLKTHGRNIGSKIEESISSFGFLKRKCILLSEMMSKTCKLRHIQLVYQNFLFYSLPYSLKFCINFN